MKENRTKRRAFVRYWERTVPWTFKKERLPYAERRRRRYALQDYMHEAIPFASFRGGRVLELGSGSGIDSAEFGRNGAEIVSLDFTETGVRSTLSTLKQAGVRASAVIRAAAQNLPFREGVFDCVYSFGVLHHIPDVGGVTKEISRVLRRRGEIICMLYNKDSLLYAYSILFLHRGQGLTEEEMVSRYSERVEGCPYTRAYTQREACALMANDFHDITTNVHFNAIDTTTERKVKTGLPDSYGLGWHLIVSARNGRARAGRPRRT